MTAGKDSGPRMIRHGGMPELIAAGLSVVASVATLIAPSWIEAVFRVDPDSGDGSVEWLITGLFAALALVWALRAWSRRGAAALASPTHRPRFLDHG
jgi:hypothetical protein